MRTAAQYITKADTVYVLVCIIALLLGGCSTTQKIPEKKIPTTFQVANRQLPPEPVYNRLRWVHLPEVIPSRKSNRSDKSASSKSIQPAPMIFPVISFDLQDGTLTEAAEMLGAGTNYKSYCDPKIADQRITLTTLGTIHELANKISDLAKIEVIIDHSKREISLVPSGTKLQTEVLENSVINNEYR